MNGRQTANPAPAPAENDDAFQAALLDGVSRTFALTIPQLPESLCKVVSNAYLLCRIVDTIEDETALSAEQKREFCRGFIDIVSNHGDPEPFARRLAPLLSDQTIPAEHELIRDIPRVIAITRSFAPEQREALAGCVATMAKGMPEFQDQNLRCGLETLADMDRYCYYVAGCVGEMLTRLFCHYSGEINQQRDTLLELSVSFGQGLQMTNILKDIWDDQQRGVCWLPQSIFNETGFDLATLSRQQHGRSFQEGLKTLVAIAHGHLQNALHYTLLIPSEETGIRNFCLWALGMALLTLRKIMRNLDFIDSNQAKISRRSVKATVLATRVSVKNDTLLKLLFKLVSIGLASPQVDCQNLANRPNQ